MNNKKSTSPIINRYIDGSYLDNNPNWDAEDAPWKVMQIIKIMESHNIHPENIAEVGCGSGAVLVELRKHFPKTDLYGYDISPDAMNFWEKHKSKNIKFVLGDFFLKNEKKYELLLVLDVIEHVGDPFDFASKLLNYSDSFIFHFPLDLSALSVLREEPLLYVRNKVGHIHYYTRKLALALLTDCGYEIESWSYTDASFSIPKRGLKTRFASLPRRLCNMISKELSVRFFGGETLIVLAHRPK